MVLLVLLGVLGVLAYGGFLLNPANRGNLLPYLLVVGAETVIALSALLAMWTILSGGHDPRDFSYNHARSRLFSRALNAATGTVSVPSRWPMRLLNAPVSVDVFITTYGEDVAVIRRTVQAAVAMQGEHETWVLDDGRSDEVRHLAQELGAKYVTRPDSRGAKAGNINHR